MKQNMSQNLYHAKVTTFSYFDTIRNGTEIKFQFSIMVFIDMLLMFVMIFLKTTDGHYFWGKSLLLRGSAPIFDIPYETGEALGIICNALPLSSVAVLIQQDNYTSPGLEQDRTQSLLQGLHDNGVQLRLFYETDYLLEFLKKQLEDFKETNTLIVGRYDPLDFIVQLTEEGLTHRLLLYLFYWGTNEVPIHLEKYLKEPMRAVIIMKTIKRVYRVYYNQDTALGRGHLRLVNWYRSGDLFLYKAPLLPPQSNVYKKLKGRVLYVPVVNSPPWHFVSYSNNSENSTFHVTGGRDDTLLRILADALHFNYEYLDPPERTQGSAPPDGNLTYTGAIGLLQRREADIYLGDVSVTWERAKVVDFSFLTLADSGAFVTHSPHRLSDTLVLLRPFRMEVWPPLAITVALSGPALFAVIATPLVLRKKTRPPGLMMQCVWFTTTIFLRQTSSELDSGCRTRMVSLLLWLSATYVLGDVYSAQLTSQLARPATESPIDNLARLERAVTERGYRIYVEKQSAALGVLQNGTGVLHRLYERMLRQSQHLVNSVEEGVQGVLQGSNAIMGGRETLYFNIRKFGAHDFQLSEKLYTRYSAVAVQQGSPYLESLNVVLMRLFEAGILDKITSNEYEQMFSVQEDAVVEDTSVTTTAGTDTAGENPPASSNDGANAVDGESEAGGNKQPKPSSSSEPKVLQAISLRMVQGAFLALAGGYVAAGIVLLGEIHHNKKEISQRDKPPKVNHLKIKMQLIKKDMKTFRKKVYRKLVFEFHKLFE